MANPILTPFPALSPLGVYPPATGWATLSTSDFTPNAGPDSYEFPIPWQPGTGTGIATIQNWQITQIYFRLRVAATVGNTTIVLERSTSTGPFFAANAICLPITIPALSNEPVPNPVVLPAIITNPSVTSNDKIRFNVLAAGTNAAGYDIFFAFTMSP